MAGVFSSIYLKKIYRLYRINLVEYQPKSVSKEFFVYQIMSAANYDEDKIRQIENIEEWLTGKIGPDIKNDGICLLALDGERVAGFNWINFNTFYMPIIDKTMTFRPDKAWSQQITVHPDYRGKGLGSGLRHTIFTELKKRGIKKFYGGTLHINVPNIQSSKRVGFEFFVDIHYKRLFGSRSWKYKISREP